MSLVVYQLENGQAECEKKHHLYEKILNNTNDGKTNNEDKPKSTVLDLRTCTQVAQTTSLIGMLENLKKLSLASQVAIESITREADKTFERVYKAHEKVIILTEKVNRIKEFYDQSQYEEIHRNQFIQRVEFQEPEQGRFNSESIPDGWYEQYQKCEDMPNFRIVDEYLLKPPYLQSYYKNYSNPDGLFSTWKETFVRHLRNEQQRERELHGHIPVQTQSMIYLKKKHSVGDVIVPEKRVKKVIPMWKKYDKNNGSKVKLQHDGAIYENIQQITISESKNPSLTRTRSSVLRSAGSQKKLDTSVLSPQDEPKIKSMEEKMKTLLKKSRSQNNTLEGANLEKQTGTISVDSNNSVPDSSPQSQPTEAVPSIIEKASSTSVIPPVPTNVPPPPPMNVIPVKPVTNVSTTSVLKPPTTVPQVTSISESLVSSANFISGKAMLKPTSPREQTARNDSVADLLEGIRKGIKLSKASERVLAEKPVAKQSFDVFSVLKEKFKFANAEMSTDSFCPSASGTFTEDW